MELVWIFGLSENNNYIYKYIFSVVKTSTGSHITRAIQYDLLLFAAYTVYGCKETKRRYT